MTGIKIKNIRELRWEFYDVLYLENMDFDIKKFMSDINFDFKINEHERTIEIFFHTRYGVQLKGEKVQILHSDVELEFQIEDFKENFEEQVDSKKIEILTTLLGITISTTRGIIHSNTKGHLMNKLILPIIDPNFLLKKKLERKELN